MTVSGDLVILARELVKLTQKWDEGTGLAEKLRKKVPVENWESSNNNNKKKKGKSRERQINYLNYYNKL